jgi:hypothetical protein
MRVGFVSGEFSARVCERVRIDSGEKISKTMACKSEVEEEEEEERVFLLEGWVFTIAGEGWVAVTSA